MNGVVVLAGGRGFLGGILAEWFSIRGWDVRILSRTRYQAAHGKVVIWDGETEGAWCRELEGAGALINLAGQSVDCRYHARNRKILWDSRILSTRILGQAVSQCDIPPRVWIQSSTATIYEHTYGPPHGENGRIAGSPEAKDEFSVELATAWEKEFQSAACEGTRKVAIRTAMVFDHSGSVLRVLRRLALCGLGGKMGHGKQYVSWIHAKDFCRAVEYLVESENAEGIYNLASPIPLSNAHMMSSIRRSFGVPFGLSAKKWMLEIGAFFLRTETELIIKSRRVVPERLLAEGFVFEHPEFDEALAVVSR